MLKKRVVTIINVDSLLGYATAFRFLKSKKDQNITVRLLCHKKDDDLKELEELGGDVIEIDYDDHSKVEKALEDTWLLLLNPEYSQNRLEYGNSILRMAKRLDVNYVVLFSYIGVDHLTSETSKEFKNLNQYKALEERLEDLYDDQHYCVIRIGFFNQLFYYLGPMLEDKNEIRLTVDAKSRWSTTDLGDVSDAVFNLSFTDIYNGANPNKKKKNQTLFVFTPDHTVTAKDVVEAANKGLNKNMTYSMVEHKELSKYLQKMRSDNRFRRRPSIELLKKDRPYTFPLGKYLSDTNIETLLEWWHLADEGDSTDEVSDDLQKSLQCPPQTINQFFKHNSDQFRLLR